eukprot:GEMP01037533.1.p1 GENE.GEMP01037533.1~~GEMP01037533.1.p1  ORF type:complete len:111 (+),score=12.64 GEMP01037533.1:1177-1509(+)
MARQPHTALTSHTLRISQNTKDPASVTGTTSHTWPTSHTFATRQTQAIRDPATAPHHVTPIHTRQASRALETTPPIIYSSTMLRVGYAYVFCHRLAVWSCVGRQDFFVFC